MREDYRFSDHAGYGEQKDCRCPGGWRYMTRFEDGDADRRRKYGREGKADPIAEACGFEDCGGAPGIVEGANEPEDEAG